MPPAGLDSSSVSPRSPGPPRVPAGRRIPSGWDAIALLMGLAWFALVFALALLQYQSGHNQSFDLGLYARSMWGVAHGFPVNPLRDQHALALHGHWIIYPLVPLAYLLPIPETLLCLQSAGLAAGGVVTHLVASERLGSGARGLLMAAAYWLFPVAINAGLFDFHYMTLAIPFAIFGLHRVERSGGKDATGWSCLAVALACREEFSLILALFGMAVAVRPGRRLLGLLLACSGLVPAAAYYLLVQPLLGADNASVGLHFGHLLEPGGLLASVTLDDALLLVFVLGSFAFLPLLCPEFALPAMAPVAMNVLSAVPGTFNPQSHYLILALPFLILASIEGAARSVALIGQRGARSCLACAVLCAVASYATCSVGPGGRLFEARYYGFSRDGVEAMRCLDRIPAGVPAMAPAHLVAHIASREVVDFRLRPDLGDRFDYVMLERQPVPWLAQTAEYRKYIATRQDQARRLEGERGYVPVDVCGPYVLLRRGGAP